MATYMEDAVKALDSLYPYIKDCREPWSLEDNIKWYNAVFHTQYKVKSGAARMAIIGDTFVIKVDYAHENVRDIGGCLREYNFYNRVKDTIGGNVLCPISRVKKPRRYYYIMPCASDVGSYRSRVIPRVYRDWLEKNHVQDLHSNNLGFYKGHVVVIDYAFNGRG